MDKITKALQKLSPQERNDFKNILLKIDSGDFSGLDLKKLKGRKDIFRIRKGKMRIIFYFQTKRVQFTKTSFCKLPSECENTPQKHRFGVYKKESSIKILSIERRSDKTYR